MFAINKTNIKYKPLIYSDSSVLTSIVYVYGRFPTNLHVPLLAYN